MNKLLLNTILAITSQKETESLQRAYLSAAMALYDLHDATIYKQINRAGTVNLVQIIKLKDSEYCADASEKYLDELPKIIAIDADIQQCLELEDIVINESVPNSVNILLPIINAGGVLLIISLKGDKSIVASLEAISYMAQIFGNFFTVINEGEYDTLTGLYNRRTFDAKLARMMAIQKSIKHEKWMNKSDIEKRELEVQACAWLVTVDIDYFKRVNDQFGHVAGDEVLLRLSQKMKECFRNTDLLFRFGGEEFVIILEPISYAKVWLALERFRKMVEDYQFPLVGSVTISTGFAGIKEQDYPVTILDYADKALYFAKEHGRNCIHSYEQLLDTGQLVAPEIEGSIDLF